MSATASSAKYTSYPSATAHIAAYVRETEVVMPAITSVLRPVASTASTTAASSHALMTLRSIGSVSGSSCVSAAMVGRLSPIATPTVLTTTGTPSSLAAAASDRTLPTTAAWSASGTSANTLSW